MKPFPEQSDQDWERLQEENKESHICPICNGTGFTLYKGLDITCLECGGTGYVE